MRESRTMMSYGRLKRVGRIREWLKKLAYASLGLDVAISLASLASLKFYGAAGVLYYLDFALTAEVVVVMVLGAAFVALLHYDKVLEGFVFMHSKIMELSPEKKRKLKTSQNKA